MMESNPSKSDRKAARKAAREAQQNKPQSAKLISQIIEHFCYSVFDDEKKEFLPKGFLDSLITREGVCQELKMSGDKDENELVDFILNRARKLFAITLNAGLSSKPRGDNGETYGELANAMLDFLDDDIDDTNLPILFDNTHTQKPFYEDGELTEPWDEAKIINFRRSQWAFLVPVFERINPILDVPSGSILPVVEKARGVESGAFGQVCRVKLHEKHDLNPIFNYDGARADVAIKVITQVYRDTDDEAKLKELENEWNREVKAHIAFRDLHHPNIIEFIASMKRGAERYLFFRWADQGTLREFWKSHERPSVTHELVRDVVGQLRGLADALDKLHNYRTTGKSDGESYRHGDLKPENILCVLERKAEAGRLDVPVLKISDMGLAKHHTVATALRKQRTSMQYTTTRYEPPEVALESTSSSARSRRYDMWSLGCVMLEMIIWLLYGNITLEAFNNKIVDEYNQLCHWFEIRKDRDGIQTLHVHRHVQETILDLDSDPECRTETAIRRLVEIVKTRLLVVELEPATSSRLDETPNSSDGSRWYSQKLLVALDEIIQKGNANPNYWFTGQRRDGIRILSKPTHLSVPSQHIPKAGVVGNRDYTEPGTLSLPVPSQEMKTRRKHLDITEYVVDNQFAEEVTKAFKANGQDLLPRVSTDKSRLCDTCQKYNIFAPNFHILDVLDDLMVKQSSCEFCRLRWEACHSLDPEVKTARFDRVQSILTLNEGRVPGLSICLFPEPSLPNHSSFQIGLPTLSDTRSSAYFDLLQQWLVNCDQHHECYPNSLKPLRPPTRLIDLWDPETEAPTTDSTKSIRLIVTNPSLSYKYVALSHPWGKTWAFRTVPENLEEHMSETGISLYNVDFPSTFRDAVFTARNLGIRYIWIDSICIIQGRNGDFLQESGRMGEVFGSAYCVLAASSAHRQQDGFLNPRGHRKFVQLPQGYVPGGRSGLYVCEFIDNFDEHVLKSPLSTRGWVMQERALARRTIYFSEKQTYFECRHGVRCETLTKVENKLTSFLGDSNFPSRLSSHLTDRGERIRFYEDLYRQYSRLNFSDMRDRPIAIAGLEQRMLRDLKARGGQYGVFDDGQSLLLRSLLWRRGAGESELKEVDFSVREGETDQRMQPPSWSWMRYEGGIDYLDLPLGEVDWVEGVVTGPWEDDYSEHQVEAGKGLIATARKFADVSVMDNEGDVKIVLDAGSDQYATAKKEWSNWACVVVGARRNLPGAAYVSMPQRRHYVLIIAPEGRCYRRVGVGYMEGRYIGEHLSDQVLIN